MENVEANLKVKDLVNYFDFEIIEGSEQSLERPIVIADTNRPGLELAGFFDFSQSKRVVILGDKEIAYIETMDERSQRISFDFITNEVTPAIII